MHGRGDAQTHDRGWRARKTRKTLNQTRKTINQKALNQKASSPVGVETAVDAERRPRRDERHRAKSAAGVKLTDEEEEVLRRYLMATPPAVPSAVARRHKQRRIGGKALSPQ